MNSVAFAVLAIVAAVNGGVIAPLAVAPLGYAHGHLPYAAPAVVHAPVVHHAPVIAKVHAPVAYAAPFAHHPAVYAHAPIVKTAAVAYPAPLLAKAALPAFAAPVYGAYGHHAYGGVHYL